MEKILDWPCGLARETEGQIELLTTDVVMPEINGRELAGKIMSTYPGIKRLFMSGYTASITACLAKVCISSRIPSR